MLARLYRRREGRDLVQGSAVERIVDPTTFPAVGHQPGVLENSEMERQPRLRGVEYVLQLAYAPLSVGEEAHDLEARFVGERMEPASGAGGVGQGCDGHAHYISTNFDTSRLALSLRLLLQVLEPRCGAEHLVVQPAIDDALPKAPLLPQLCRRNPLLLRPLVDGLRCEPEVRRDLFDGQNVVVERRCAALVAVPGHGRLRRRVVSASVSASGSTRPRNRGSVSGLTDAAVGLSSPCISLFTA